MILVKNKNIKLVLSSQYCRFIFLVFFILSFFIIPRHIINSKYILEILIFMVLFALNITFLIYDLKQKIKISKNNNTKILSILTGAIGLSAMQFCGINSLSCGSGILFGIFGAIFPNFLVHFMIEYGVWVLRFSILIQVISLYYLMISNKK